MDIDAPHTTILSTPCERETDPAIDDSTTSSFAIIVDPTEKVPEPCSTVIDRPTPAPVHFSARLAEKRGRTIDDQPSVHTIYTVDPVDANPDPVNIEDALSRWDHARWRLTCHEELIKMDQYSTWTVVRRPLKDINVVDTKWVLYIKNPGTKEERYKARIIARGFSIMQGEDYFETHASVVKSMTIRILLSLAVALGMIVELADVETAYLNAALYESIHAKQPPYFELKDHAKYVLLLKQALYRLPQSEYEWAAMLRTALEAIGFHSIADDDNLYSNSNSNNSIDREGVSAIFITVYVDDLVIASKDQSAINATIHSLNKTFNVRSLGPIS
jgi:Reverse transcriptase (RNA-dependent DNA polymerase)